MKICKSTNLLQGLVRYSYISNPYLLKTSMRHSSILPKRVFQFLNINPEIRIFECLSLYLWWKIGQLMPFWGSCLFVFHYWQVDCYIVSLQLNIYSSHFWIQIKRLSNDKIIALRTARFRESKLRRAILDFQNVISNERNMKCLTKILECR